MNKTWLHVKAAVITAIILGAIYATGWFIVKYPAKFIEWFIIWLSVIIAFFLIRAIYLFVLGVLELGQEKKLERENDKLLKAKYNSVTPTHFNP